MTYQKKGVKKNARIQLTRLQALLKW